MLRLLPILLAISTFAHLPRSEDIFTNIYDAELWGVNLDGESSSGQGSCVENAMEYVVFLNKFIVQNKISTIVDVGCGDWQIMRLVNLRDAQYLGVDVVKSVVERNNKKFGSHVVHFSHADCIDDDLPAADLLLCKDVLIHFSNADILKFAHHFSKYKHILITTDVDPYTFSASNTDCCRGDWRRVDISTHPFNQKGMKLLIYPAESYNQHFKLVFYIHNE